MTQPRVINGVDPLSPKVSVDLGGTFTIISFNPLRIILSREFSLYSIIVSKFVIFFFFSFSFIGVCDLDLLFDFERDDFSRLLSREIFLFLIDLIEDLGLDF